ncbi:MAG: FMN-binding protein, partial [Elusimicrobiota bacterium]|nr:FMN-binding protein [Elusimicrobiota bacterium]
MKKIVLIFALITTLIAFAYNIFCRLGLFRSYIENTLQSDEIKSKLKKLFLETDKIKFHTTPVKYYSIYKNNKLAGYAFLTTDIAPGFSTGYTTQIKTLVALSVDRKISSLLVIEHYETPQYVNNKKLTKFLLQFKGKSITDKFILNEDIDGITGATITSAAIINSVKESISRFSTAVLNSEMKYSKPVTKFKIVNFILLVAIFLLSIYGVACWKTLNKPRPSLEDLGKPHSSLKELGKVAKGSVVRYALLGAGIVFLGFYTNTLLSIVNIISNITRKFPALPEGLF